MKLRISHKLFLAMLAATSLAVVFMLLAQRYTFERGLLNYAQEVEFKRLQVLMDELEERYASENSWAFIAGNEQWPVELVRFCAPRSVIESQRYCCFARYGGKPTDRPLRDGGGQPDFASPPVSRLWERIGLLDANQQWVAGATVPEDGVRRELITNGAVVGYLALVPARNTKR